jgi:putative N-acetylmannosamine-6-phosphate epimerase
MPGFESIENINSVSDLPAIGIVKIACGIAYPS